MDENEIKNIATVVFLDEEGNEIDRTSLRAYKHKQVLSPNTEAIWWGVEDIRPEKKGDADWFCLSCAQDILYRMVHQHDANYGISWDTISNYKDEHKVCSSNDKECRFNNAG
jgi:hypothetical protein